MCIGMDRKYKEKEVTGAIGGMKLMGASEKDIIEKLTKKYNVTKEYVLALLEPQKA